MGCRQWANPGHRGRVWRRETSCWSKERRGSNERAYHSILGALPSWGRITYHHLIQSSGIFPRLALRNTPASKHSLPAASRWSPMTIRISREGKNSHWYPQEYASDNEARGILPRTSRYSLGNPHHLDELTAAVVPWQSPTSSPEDMNSVVCKNDEHDLPLGVEVLIRLPKENKHHQVLLLFPRSFGPCSNSRACSITAFHSIKILPLIRTIRLDGDSTRAFASFLFQRWTYPDFTSDIHYSNDEERFTHLKEFIACIQQ